MDYVTMISYALKAALLQWRMFAEAVQAADVSLVVTEMTNNALQNFAQAGERAVVTIADAVQQPTLLVATVVAVSNSLTNQSVAMIAAYDHGQQLRNQVESSIVLAHREITSVQQRVDQNVLTHLLNEAKNPVSTDLILE